MSGVIQGGMEWVQASFGLTAVVLVAYGISLQLRLGRHRGGQR